MYFSRFTLSPLVTQTWLLQPAFRRWLPSPTPTWITPTWHSWQTPTWQTPTWTTPTWITPTWHTWQTPPWTTRAWHTWQTPTWITPTWRLPLSSSSCPSCHTLLTCQGLHTFSRLFWDKLLPRQPITTIHLRNTNRGKFLPCVFSN